MQYAAETYPRPSKDPAVHPISVALPLACIVALAIAVSFFLYAPMSMRLDEAQNLWQSSHSTQGALALIASDVHVPAYHLLLHAWLYVAGTDIAATRILSLIFFAAAIVAVYILARAVAGHGAGVTASLLAALSPFLQWYGQELRMYSLLALVSAAHQALFIHLMKKPDAGRGVWIAYGAAALVGIYTHYFFILNLLAQAIFIFWYAEQFGPTGLRRFLMTAVTLFAAFIPWLLYIFLRGETGYSQPLILTPTATNLVGTPFQFLYGFQDDAFNTLVASAWPVVALLLFLLLNRRSRPSAETAYLLTAFLVPIAAAFAVSVTLRPLYLTRYLIGALPPLYAMAAWMLAQYPPRAAAVVRPLLIGSMAVALVYQAWNPGTPVKENYRDAAAYLSEHATAQDIIIVSAPFTIYPVEYYYRGPARIVTLPAWDRRAHGALPSFAPAAMEEDIQRYRATHRTAWVLFSYDQGYERDIRAGFETRFARLEQRSFSKGVMLEAYRLRYDFPEVAER